MLFIAAVVALLLRLDGNVGRTAVRSSARANTPETRLMAALLAAISHGLIASFELLGRHLTGHGLPMARLGTVVGECIGAFSHFASTQLSGYVPGQVLEVKGGQYRP